MKDKFVGYFNTKKVTLYSLGLLVTTLILIPLCIYVFTLPASTVITAKLPIIGKTENQIIIKGLILIVVIPFEIYSMYLWSLVIKLILVNKDKKFFVINHYGILWYNYNIFSKPILIEWKHIKNICVLNPKNHLFANNYKRAVALQLTQEFYNNSSFFKRMVYKFNRKLSNGYEININLNFSTCKADEVLDEIYKYCFK